jgi:hypothetical protein
MSVDQKGTIDVLTRSRETGGVTLTISDHLDWAQSLEHIALLQAKIDAYLRFIASGQVWERCPDAIGKGITILVAFRVPPPDGDVLDFLTAVEEKVVAAGYGFEYKVFELGPLPNWKSGRS